jgi:hypothetical protein
MSMSFLVFSIVILSIPFDTVMSELFAQMGLRTVGFGEMDSKVWALSK